MKFSEIYQGLPRLKRKIMTTPVLTTIGILAFLVGEISGVIEIIGCIVFKADALDKSEYIKDLPEYSLNYSFALSIVGALVGIAGGALILVGGKKMTDYSPM